VAGKSASGRRAEPEPRGDFFLAFFDAVIAEPRPGHSRADDVVVVDALVEFEDRRPALEMMAA
jgi:hypothetical protein